MQELHNLAYYAETFCTLEFQQMEVYRQELRTKSSIYFGEVSLKTQQEIIQDLWFSVGSLPFRYLGVPLRSKKLSVGQRQPLLDKMLGRVTSWTTKFLSYAGRLQLIKSVLTAIQSFWAQISPLPKAVLYKIETICRRFLWTGEADTRRKLRWRGKNYVFQNLQEA